MPAHTPVARARPPEISDSQLRQIANLAHAARSGDIRTAEVDYLVICIGPLLEELIERREVDAQIADMLTAANVVPLHAPEAS